MALRHTVIKSRRFETALYLIFMAAITQQCVAVFKIRRDTNYSCRNSKTCVSTLSFFIQRRWQPTFERSYASYSEDLDFDSRSSDELFWLTKKYTVISMRFTGALESLGRYKQINKRVLLCVTLRSLRSLSDLVQPLHFLQQQNTHSSGRQAAKTVTMSLLFSVIISIFRFLPCCLCEWVQSYISCFRQPLKMSASQRTACLYKGICKLSMLPMVESLL